MRTTGLLERSAGLGPGDHICWVYDDERERDRVLADFLAEGLARGERIKLAAWDDGTEARAALAPLGDLGALEASGALEVELLTATYASASASAAEQLPRRLDALERALADGFTGLRAAGDVTALVREPGPRKAFAEYELLVDRLIAEHALTAMCLYDGRVVGDGVHELTCLHAATNRRGVGFSCTAGHDGALRLAGEVDATDADVLAGALAHASRDGADPLTIDARALTFIDHRGMMALAAAAPSIDLVTGFGTAGTLAGLLDLGHVTVRAA